MMGKKALIITVTFMIVGLLAAGCGSGKSSSDAKKVMDKALNNMRSWKSFKATIKTSGASNSSAPTSGSTALLEVSNEGGKTAMHTVMDYAGSKVEQYQVDGVIYAYQEAQGWLKQTASSTKSANVDIADSLKTGIKDLKILSQDSKSYRLSFKMTASDSSTQGSSTPSSTEETEFVLKVDKPTMNIQEISVKSSTGSTKGQTETITFSDVNSPITITLPEEAKNAKSATEAQQSSP
jgi:hypothetical protein